MKEKRIRIAPLTCHPDGSERGLTLIEMSIVLVVIGLLVAGVMAGKDLIRTSELRSHVSEIQELDAALMAFRLRYNGLAGDLNTAGRFRLNGGNCLSSGGAYTGGIGNGNGRLNSNYPIMEDTYVFCNLYNASLRKHSSTIGGPSFYTGWGVDSYCWQSGCRSVPSKIKGKLLSAHADLTAFGPARQYHFYISSGTGAAVVEGFHPVDQLWLDSKQDDGLPNSGKLRAFATHAASPTTGSAGSANCVNNSVTPSVYNSRYSGGVCTPGYKMGAYE